ncbi:tetratricopeptide repeat protein [Tuwongella immobilis]|uniref:Uncharacterized protein n=1 Tax=Tuwongella immobilis TaxID=692036 RepID=A0A6C2YHB5_9BACT|nr:tetratricopeptide repeat protein [Tuwongella immobilis]VIP00641.1 tetratricopeptide repeat protein : Tetratricopeptide TPR_1 repeat-containing protein OS=Isosphaera pallida (strain ATCC 43644 / DSM 9630 / IS1B) GN=Isop_2788 PE=4 SV=1: HEAT_2: TPR_11 [Tuwongella immobilis]VTR96700.1 tetratricopeptide repeat protein : Tetratricopeptide TPR_1 repeat-containing protein OS=Isosphaera pallida (strain ATCC 43644 / DSM 9630 / IS1B) GN=Isop_2788 PE=4 SV=1: HEAT_2: TPR_11 [Tuwongella immobilis]
MSVPKLRELYEQLPQARQSDDAEDWAVRMRGAYADFKEQVLRRYTEGTLQRLLTSDDNLTRRAAVDALGLIGSMACVRDLAERLHDEDPIIVGMTEQALWTIWFRGDSPEEADRLDGILRLENPRRVLTGLDELVARSPNFAEAINQRAIVYFGMKDYARSIDDCRRVLQLNPHHFGAQAGMGQCYLKLRHWRDALHAFELALRIHPGMDGVKENIRLLREAIGEDPTD